MVRGAAQYAEALAVGRSYSAVWHSITYPQTESHIGCQQIVKQGHSDPQKVNNPSCSTVSWSCALALSWAGVGFIIGTLSKIIVHFTFVHSVNVLNIPNTPLALLSSPGAPSRCLVAKMSNTISLTLPKRSLRTHDAPHHIAPLPPNLICNGRCRKMTALCFK